jgi:hypothetical protein
LSVQSVQVDRFVRLKWADGDAASRVIVIARSSDVCLVEDIERFSDEVEADSFLEFELLLQAEVERAEWTEEVDVGRDVLKDCLRRGTETLPGTRGGRSICRSLRSVDCCLRWSGLRGRGECRSCRRLSGVLVSLEAAREKIL